MIWRSQSWFASGFYRRIRPEHDGEKPLKSQEPCWLHLTERSLHWLIQVTFSSPNTCLVVTRGVKVGTKKRDAETRGCEKPTQITDVKSEYISGQTSICHSRHNSRSFGQKATHLCGTVKRQSRIILRRNLWLLMLPKTKLQMWLFYRLWSKILRCRTAAVLAQSV